MRPDVLRSGFAVLLAGAFAGGEAVAQEASTHPTNLPQTLLAEGVPVGDVLVKLRKLGGSAEQQATVLAAVRKIGAELEGEPFSAIETRRALARIAREPGVRNVEYRLLPQGANAVRIQFLVDLAETEKKSEEVPSGILTGDLLDFPVFYKDDRSLVTAIVAGGLGVYSDGNAWFGSPQLFLNPKGYLPRARTTWTEGNLEVGGGFATRLGDAPVYVFGALTGMKSWTIGEDIFRPDNRDFDAVEKAYAGLFYADRDSRSYAKLGIGRQTFTLNDGFLVNMVRGSVNVGDRGASYLGPRLANEFSVLADGRLGSWGFNAFYIDPSELDGSDTHTTFLGGNVKHRFTDDVSLDGTLMTIPTSTTDYVTANPPPPEMRGLMALFESIGLGPGAALPAGHEHHALIGEGVALGQRAINARISSAPTRNGWLLPSKNTGKFSLDPLDQAVTQMTQIGVLPPEEALYFTSSKDAEGGVLDGSNYYQLTFPAGALPPVDVLGFWSVTMYRASDLLLVPNDINRYLIRPSTEGLESNADGSLTIHISNKRPDGIPAGNWLPAPAEPFQLALRAYLPLVQVRDGSWVPPGIVKQ